MSTDPPGRQQRTSDRPDHGQYADAPTDDSDGSTVDHDVRRQQIRELILVSGLFLVVVGLLIWIAPRELFAHLLAYVEGAERNSRWLLAGAIFLGVFLTRFVLDAVPEEPIPPSRVRTRALERSNEQLAVQPGIDVDNRLAAMLADQATYERRRVELTADLKEIAIGTLCYTDKVDRERAIQQLESGEWTDDRMAAALFKDRTDVSFRMRFKRWLSPRQTYRREVEAAVDEICAQVDR